MKIKLNLKNQNFADKLTFGKLLFIGLLCAVFTNITNTTADTKQNQAKQNQTNQIDSKSDSKKIEFNLDNKYKPTYNALNSLIEKYDEKVFLSFFSLEELRPYSILQFERFYENYDKKWVNPTILISDLNNNEKDSLKLILTKYIFDNNDKLNFNNVNRYSLIAKVQNWNSAYNNISNIMFNYNIELSDILNQLYNISTTKVVLEKYARLGEFKGDMLSDLDKNEAYHVALNRIASLSQKEQLGLFSSLYENLYLVSSN